MKKILSIIIAVVMIASAFSVLPAFATDGGAAAPANDYLNGTTNYQDLYSVDFSTIKTDNQFKEAGWNVLTTGGALTDQETVTYPDYGVKMKTTSSTYIVLDKVQLNETDNYVIDYTFKFDTSAWIFYGAMGFDSATAAPDETEWKYIDGNSCFKIRAAENGNRGGADGFTYYTDENYFHATTSGFEEDGYNAAFVDYANIRVRLLVTAGGCTKAFLTVGDETYYALRSKSMNTIAGYFGFMQNGNIKGNERAIGLVNFKVSKVDLIDTTGGSEVVAEKTKDYADKTETYYKDGYVLHNMDFSKVNSFADTGYSFTKDSPTDRVVEVRGDKLYVANKSDSGAYLLFTGNAIPSAITEYTVTYSFRFLDGGDKPYLSFIRGLTLEADGSRDRSREVDIYQKNVTKPAYVGDCTADDDAKWAIIAEAMMNGEEVAVCISSIGRKIDKVMFAYGQTMVTLTMDASANKQAYDGYMGLKISPKSAVEISDIAVIAGAYDYITEPIFPTGIEAGALVQNVTAEAVNTTGTKPSYGTTTPGGTTDGTTDGGDKTDATTAATTAAPKATEATEAEEEKKGCKSSVAIALPAILVTTVFGTALCKKKED